MKILKKLIHNTLEKFSDGYACAYAKKNIIAAVNSGNVDIFKQTIAQAQDRLSDEQLSEIVFEFIYDPHPSFKPYETLLPQIILYAKKPSLIEWSLGNGFIKPQDKINQITGLDNRSFVFSEMNAATYLFVTPENLLDEQCWFNHARANPHEWRGEIFRDISNKDREKSGELWLNYLFLRYFSEKSTIKSIETVISEDEDEDEIMLRFQKSMVRQTKEDRMSRHARLKLPVKTSLESPALLLAEPFIYTLQDGKTTPIEEGHLSISHRVYEQFIKLGWVTCDDIINFQKNILLHHPTSPVYKPETILYFERVKLAEMVEHNVEQRLKRKVL